MPPASSAATPRDLLVAQAVPGGPKATTPPENSAGTTSSLACLHCGLPVPHGAADGFCCAGCRLVYALIHREGLDRYYALRDGTGQPVAATTGRDHKWLEPVEAHLAGAVGIERVDLDVQGLHCAACVWLIDQVFRKQPGGASVVVNPALGSIQLAVSRGFSLRGFVERVEGFGYLLGPALKHERAAHGDLLFRMGACVALAMNSMLFAIALYAGLAEGPLFHLFRALDFTLAVASVLVGGTVYFRAAWQGLRRGLLHLDVPIALGIALAFASSTYAYFSRSDGAVYFDTLSIFIALMLVGRFLQERVLEKNRRYLLESDGVDGLLTRRIVAERVELVPCRQVVAGDRLVVAPGDLVPVAAVLEGRARDFSLDWINGESNPRPFASGALVPAGAFLSGHAAATVRATQPFEASPLVELLRSPLLRPGDGPRTTRFWQRFAGYYVWGVLLAAALGFVVAWARTHSVAHALDVVTAVLIVTCPCALGLATPMAYELVQSGLRRAGLFVRSPGFLDRAPSVRRVVFDKTGTLTTGSLRVVDAEQLAQLDEEARAALYNLAARSTHPKSMAVRAALEARGLGGGYLDALEVTEHPGQGLALDWHGRTWRLGAPKWAAHDGVTTEADLVYSCDGEVLCALDLREELRPDAAAEVAALAEAGNEVWVLSGDEPARVAELARACGVPTERAVGGRSASEKAAFVRALDRRDTLMIGDGINDSLVVGEAYCSGTPAIDRPFMAARSDFYFTTPGIRPIRLALSASRALARVVRRNLAFAVGYNLVAVALAWAGLMSPLLCAVLMPLSSITVLLATFAALAPGGPAWR